MCLCMHLLTFYFLYQLEYIDVGTPLSNAYYLGQPQGEMYGLDHARARWLPETIMNLRPDSGIPGLYLTGKGELIVMDHIMFLLWSRFCPLL